MMANMANSNESGFKLSKGERKTLKTLENFDFSRISGVEKINFQKNNNLLFSMDYPDVFKSSRLGNFLIIGKPAIKTGNN
mmetsp:Transcript_12810/g.20142  ORF Transcript_12810/g.20142 Transcript_12810/m.20142 type:complete len:80 (+) Transcript_12810:925-1164(+)